MKPYYPSKDVGFYAKRVLNDLGLREPPVEVEPILDYFGLELHMISEKDCIALSEKCELGEIDVPAFLMRKGDQGTIFVKEDDPVERQRLSIFHECGHFDIPWHRGMDYLCDCKISDLQKISRIEKEAFEYAGCIIFPTQVFFDDLMSVPISLDTINDLANRYQASFEATAIKYVTYNPEMCAILYLKPNPKVGNTGNPYIVRYWVKSRGFHRYRPPGTEIKHHDLIEDCLRNGRSGTDDISASVFGSQKKHSYIAEVRPFGPDQVCVLLNIPNKQLTFC